MKNQSNVSATLGVLAALAVASSAHAQTTIQIPLNYNFNGIVHAGEDNQADNPNGYRSISDRGLNFSGGLPSDPMVDKYSLVSGAGLLDIVHLGNRNTVTANPANPFAFDAVPDGDDVGIQPAWLPNPDQSGPQTTLIGGPGITLDLSSSASFIYQISDGGGNFDVRFGFSSGADVISTLGGGDWFGGPYAGTDSVDRGNLFGAGLHIIEGSVNLAAEAGRTLTSITFENRSNTDAGYAILGAIVTVPEPTSLTLLLGAGIVALGLRRSRK